MQKLKLVPVILWCSLFACISIAQTNDEVQLDESSLIEPSAPKKIRTRRTTPPSAPQQQPVATASVAPAEPRYDYGNVSAAANDYLRPGWNSNIRKGVGFSGSFLGTGNSFVFETDMDKPSSWSYFLSFAKNSDTFSEASTSTNSGTGTVTTVNSTARTGVKNPLSLGVGVAYNMRIYKNPFFMARWGLFGGVDYYMKTSYGTGTTSDSVSSASPTTVTTTQTNFGDVEVTRSPVFRVGPVFDAYVFLRWIPHLAVGFQGGILYTTDQETKTQTSTVSQTFQTLNGAAQTPSSYADSNVTTKAKNGGTGSTFAIAGQNFNLLGNFVIRYVW